MALLASLWLVVGFVAAGDDDQGEFTIRLALLLAVALGTVWLVAAGFDHRHPGSNPMLVAARLLGVTVVAAIALVVTGDPWVFAGDSGSAVSTGEQAVIAGLWLAALGAAANFQRRRPPVPGPVAAAPPTGTAVPGRVAPTGLRATVRRWPHLIIAVALVGPMIMIEGIVAVFGLCGLGGTAVNLAALLVLTVPIGLPGIGVVRDRQLQRRVESAAARGLATPSSGFAVAFGTMVLVAILHLALLIGLLVLAAVGADGPRRCFN